MNAALALAQAHPHDFTLQYPPRREYFQERFRAPCAQDFLQGLRTVLLYVHVPFCAARCAYCNFAIDVNADRSRQHRYVDAVLLELERIDRALPDDARIGGIDVGGGTPTMLENGELDRLLAGLAPFLSHASVPRPLSVETTPSIAASEPDKLTLMRARGVDRISVGLQSTDGATLAALGRDESHALCARAVDNLRHAGFARIGIDLIFGLPGQSEAAWASDLDRTIALAPDSITTYDCLYRGKGRALTRRTLTLPSPAHLGALYDLGFARLRQAGYHATYGSVNHSRRAGETGTSPYFEGRLLDGLPYLGVGNYATSHRGDLWTFAEPSVDRWIASRTIRDAYLLPRAETMTKYALLSLSFGRLDRDRFLARFQTTLEDRWGDRLAFALAEGFLVEDARGYGVRPGRFDALPKLRALLYPDDAIAWLSKLRSERTTLVA